MMSRTIAFFRVNVGVQMLDNSCAKTGVESSYRRGVERYGHTANEADVNLIIIILARRK
jgi:hypothetical protein